MTRFSEIVLASSSPRRVELLHSLGLNFDVQPSGAEEGYDPSIPPAKVVEELSHRKAKVIAEQRHHGIIIGSDTIVVLEGVILGKPIHEEDAFRMLSLLQGRTHAVYSGLACIDAASGQTVVGHRMTLVTMARMSEPLIRRYIATGEPMDKAGSYAIQGIGATFVERIEGDYFTVVGLPVSLLAQQLNQLGISIL